MKREILFRGKRVDNGGWVEGFAVKWETWNNSTETWTGRYGIVPTGWCNMKPNDCFDVIPETVGQFTGLTDKNGVKIFEGDIVSFKRGIENWTGKFITTIHGVYWDKTVSRFSLGKEQEGIKFRSHPRYEYEVIGKIYDNPSKLCPEN